MAKRKFILTPEEAADLEAVLSTAGDDHAYDRIRAVLGYHNGVKWTELAARFHCSRSTLLHWCRLYRRLGKEALISRTHNVTPVRLTAAQQIELAQRLANFTPAQVFSGAEATDRTVWTAKDLFRAIRMWYGVVYNSPTTYYSLLTRLTGIQKSNPPDD
jgi:transposase